MNNTQAEHQDERGNGDARSHGKVSLHPLTLEQATKALLDTPPPKEEEHCKGNKENGGRV